MARMFKASAYHYLYSSSQWHKLRYYQLQSKPLCALCEAQGFTMAAAIVDHVKPHKGARELFFNSHNLQSLCKPCHDKHKRLKELHGIMRGHDLNGWPLDSDSHFIK
jgi:5-methylcytosine-specific restriction endonuclease McrA